MASIHHIPLTRSNLIGSYTCETQPILKAASGDTLRFATLDAGWGTGVSWEQRHKPFDRRAQLDSGHAMIGPIYIEEAKKGMVLEVRLNEIIPGEYGFTCAGQYPNWQNEKLKLTDYPELTLNWKMNKASNEAVCTIRDQSFAVALKPFMGNLGMPPEEKGIHSTWPPRYCGGNLDCKELVSGSVLYLPISVDGAYFSIGDGHATQADGEVSCQAIECPMDMVDVTLTLHEKMKLANPRANTPSGWITFGFHEDLNEATVEALDDMLNLMREQYGLGRVEAMAIGSSVIDLRITQIVNGVKGVHACLPHDAIRIK